MIISILGVLLKQVEMLGTIQFTCLPSQQINNGSDLNGSPLCVGPLKPTRNVCSSGVEKGHCLTNYNSAVRYHLPLLWKRLSFPHWPKATSEALKLECKYVILDPGVLMKKQQRRTRLGLSSVKRVKSQQCFIVTSPEWNNDILLADCHCGDVVVMFCSGCKIKL